MITITNSKRGNIDQGHFGDNEIGGTPFGGRNIGIKDDGTIIITNKGASS